MLPGQGGNAKANYASIPGEARRPAPPTQRTYLLSSSAHHEISDPMKHLLRLSTIYREHASVHVAVPDDPDEFESLLLRAYETARGKWQPAVLPSEGNGAKDQEDFTRFLAQRLHVKFAGVPLAQMLKDLALTDLYLAYACLRHEPKALEMLDHDYLANLPTLIRDSRGSQDEINELRQMVRVQILVGPGRPKPELAEYKGTGPLRKWIQMVAAHLVRKLNAPSRRMTPREDADALIEALPAPDDPVVDALRKRHLPHILEALVHAISTLSPDQRHLLRLHFRDRLSTSKIALLYGVNQSTIWRDIKKALDAVYTEMKRNMQERLNLSTHDFTSLVNALRSQFDMSISQILNERV